MNIKGEHIHILLTKQVFISKDNFVQAKDCKNKEKYSVW